MIGAMGSHTLPTIDMSWIPKYHLLIFSLVLFILIQRFSTCYLSFPSESKDSILAQVRNNSLHKLSYGHSSTFIVLLNCPYYFIHLVLCKLCLLSYIHEVHVIKTLCNEYVLFVFWLWMILLSETMFMTFICIK